jgi:hypothetical protein
MSPVIRTIINRYTASRAGKTGRGQRDLIFPFNDLLRESGCLRGTQRYEAEQELEELVQLGLLVLETAPRNPSEIFRVRLPLRCAETFVERFHMAAPGSLRIRLAEQFLQMGSAAVPERFQSHWVGYCQSAAQTIINGGRIAPFDPNHPKEARTLLESTVALLNWQGESYLRFASCAIFGESKRLEKCQSSLERILAEVTHGALSSLEDLGITETGGGFWIHGPGVLVTARGPMDFGVLDLPIHVSGSDLMSGSLVSESTRWLTVENETMLLELAKLRSGSMLLSSGFRGGMPNHAVIHTLSHAPLTAELWHFGDADPKGFDILRHLRQNANRVISSLHMTHRIMDGSVPLSVSDKSLINRLLKSDFLTTEEKAVLSQQLATGNKGAFEQESLGHPCRQWPFYSQM